jgi:hypothetical protein
LYTNLRAQTGPKHIAIKYTNRAISTATGQKETAPIPGGLSGTLMVSTPDLLLNKIKVFGVFTEERLSKAIVFGTHVAALHKLMRFLRPR